MKKKIYILLLLINTLYAKEYIFNDNKETLERAKLNKWDIRNKITNKELNHQKNILYISDGFNIDKYKILTLKSRYINEVIEKNNINVYVIDKYKSKYPNKYKIYKKYTLLLIDNGEIIFELNNHINKYELIEKIQYFLKY